MLYWILVDKKPVEEPDMLKWAEWFGSRDGKNPKRVALIEKDGIRVSTVFLGIDHGFGEGYAPVLFETMIFGGKEDEYQERYCTWEEAEAGHAKAVRLAFGDNDK